jgi:hypothetical protein
MAGFQLIAPMPALTLDAGCTVTFEAIDPDTGAAISGVEIASATVYAVNFAPDEEGPPPAEELPLFAPMFVQVSG